MWIMDMIKDKISQDEADINQINSAEEIKSDLSDEALDEIAGGAHSQSESSVKTRCRL